MIKIIREREHYANAICLDGEFRCSCDTMAEVTEELISIEEENK